MKAFLALLAAAGLLAVIYQYTGWTPQDMLPAKPVPVRALSARELASFTAPLKIDEKFYRASPKSPDPWVAPLYGRQKTALLINWQGKQDKFLPAFKNLLKRPEYKNAYRRKIYVLRSNFITWKYDSAKQLIMETCAQNAVCIINPRTREIAVLPQTDASYLAAFLEKYKDW